MRRTAAREIMNPNVIVVPADWNVREVAQLFVEQAISGAPVVDEDGSLIGVISLMDIARYQSMAEDQLIEDRPHDYYLQGWEEKLYPEEIKSFHIESVPNARARDLMTPMVFKVQADLPASEVAQIMVQGRIHRLFVVDDGKVVGIITALDLLKLVGSS